MQFHLTEPERRALRRIIWHEVKRLPTPRWVRDQTCERLLTLTVQKLEAGALPQLLASLAGTPQASAPASSTTAGNPAQPT